MHNTLLSSSIGPVRVLFLRTAGRLTVGDERATSGQFRGVPNFLFLSFFFRKTKKSQKSLSTPVDFANDHHSIVRRNVHARAPTVLLLRPSGATVFVKPSLFFFRHFFFLLRPTPLSDYIWVLGRDWAFDGTTE